MDKFQQGILFALLASIFIGTGSVFLSQASRQVHPLYLIVTVSLISSILYFGITRIFKIKTDFKKAVKKYKKELFWIILLRTSLGSFILTMGFSLTNATRAIFMLRLEPIFVALIGYSLLKEMIKPKEIFLILILVFGAVLLSTSGNFNFFTQSNIGDALVAFSLLFFALSYVPAKRIMEKIDAITVNIITNFLGGLILLILVLLTLPLSSLTITKYGLYMIFGYVILFFIFGLTLWYSALKTVESWRVSSLLSLTPIAGWLLAYFWLGETLNQIQIISAVIILAGSYMLTKK